MKLKERIGARFDLNELKFSIKDNVLTMIKWIIFGCIIGVIVGIVGAAFHHAVEGVTELRGENPWLLYLLPIAGPVIVASYHVTGMSDDKGTEFVISSVRDAQPLRIRTAPLIFLGSVLTHVCGGSAGREGAALQLGGSISSSLGKWIHIDEKDERVLTMTGMAAGFSALFGTPLASAIFAMELISVGIMYYAALVPCMLGALIALLTAQFLGVTPTAFTVAEIPAITPATLALTLVLGILCALVAMLFCLVMHLAPKFYNKITTNPYLKAFIGGCIVMVLILLLGKSYSGAGMPTIEAAVEGTARPEAFLIKILLTALTLAAGYKGGEIVPALFVGSTFGCAVSVLLGLPASFAAAAGMVSVFCGVTNCPLTAILLAYELFGGEGLPLFAVAISVSYMLSGYYSLYSAQKIVYSKTQLKYIDRSTH